MILEMKKGHNFRKNILFEPINSFGFANNILLLYYL